jgi:hypothetical protein
MLQLCTRFLKLIPVFSYYCFLHIKNNLIVAIIFRTPLHADVFTSYSWSANIVGRKKWLLFPPHEEDHLRDLYGQLAYDAASEELNDHTKYKTYSKELKSFNVIQEAGEIIFVPSGWHHQVWNLVNTYAKKKIQL